MCLIEFDDEIKSIREIAIKGFYEKANQMLNPKVRFCGIPGMRKLSKEILSWKDELTVEEYETALRNIVMFTGTVPILPNRLIMIEEKDEIEHRAARREYSTLLMKLGEKYGFHEWKAASNLFSKSGIIIQEMTNLIVEYLLKESKELNGLPNMKNTFAKMFNEIPKRPNKGDVVDMKCDFSAINQILPHPIYADMFTKSL